MYGDTQDDLGRRIPSTPGSAETPHGLVEGARVGPYHLRHRLGAGGMGEVWEGWDPRLMRPTAIKLIRGARRDEPRARARFIAEARALAALSHPAIVPIYDVGQTDDGDLYLAMARLDATPLDRLALGPWPTDRVLRLLERLAEGLGAAHRAGIVHRDLKPSNILIGPDDAPYIIDFGLAERSGDRAAGNLDGTPGFMAPELLAGRSVGPSADVFGLGIIAYMLLSGRHPVARDARRTDRWTPPPLASLRPDLPDAIVSLVHACLAEAPERRPVDGDALHAALRAITRSPLRWGRRKKALLSVALIGAVVTGVVFALPAPRPPGLPARPRVAVVVTTTTPALEPTAQGLAEALRVLLDDASAAIEVMPLEATAPGLADVTLSARVERAGPGDLDVTAVMSTADQLELGTWSVSTAGEGAADALAAEALEALGADVEVVGRAPPLDAMASWADARRALAEGDLDRALAANDRARERAPGLVGPQLTALILSYNGTGVDPQRQATIDAVLAVASERDRGTLLALRALAAFEPEAGLRAFDAHLTRFPNDVVAREKKLMLLMHGRVADLERAEAEARAILERAPDHLVAVARLVRILAWRGRGEAAATLAAGLSGDSPGARRVRAELALYQGDADQALRALDGLGDPTSFHWRMMSRILRNQPGDCLLAAADGARRIREAATNHAFAPAIEWTQLLRRHANICAGNFAEVRAEARGLQPAEGLDVGTGQETLHALDLIEGKVADVEKNLAGVPDSGAPDGDVYRALFFLLWASEDDVALARWARACRARAGALPSWNAAGLSWIRMAGALEARALLVSGRHAEALAQYRAIQVAPNDILLEGHLGERLALAGLLAAAEERAGLQCVARASWKRTLTMNAERLNQPWIERIARDRLAALRLLPCQDES